MDAAGAVFLELRNDGRRATELDPFHDAFAELLVINARARANLNTLADLTVLRFALYDARADRYGNGAWRLVRRRVRRRLPGCSLAKHGFLRQIPEETAGR